MTAQLVWTVPDVVAGEPVSAVTVTATATVNVAEIGLLGFFGVASVDGTAHVTGAVVAPGKTIDTALGLVVSRTPVPSSGPMVFHAAGTVGGLVLPEIGQAFVDIDTALSLSLTALDANGNQIGTGSETCTLNPGQSTRVFSFEIMSAPPVTPIPTTTRAVPPPAPVAVGGTGRAGASGAGSSGGRSSGSGVSGSRLLVGGPSIGGSVVSSGASPTTRTPASVTATKSPVRDSALMSNRIRLRADWWLPVAITVIVLAGVVGGVTWLRSRRRVRGG